MLRLCLSILLVALKVAAQETTENPHNTVTYNPGEDCLPYDGSVVPDCSKYVDPITKQPYYHEHSSNCSRFWECGPAGETCLFECAACQTEMDSNPLCNSQWALTFDVRFQFPVGPVCDWPSTINCTLGCPEDAECCSNYDCNKCSWGYCNLDWTCTYDPVCECSSDQECENFDGVCNVPAPHDPESCAFCFDGQCKGGCADLGENSDNCPGSHPTCSSSHVCGCAGNEECEMYDGLCDMTDSDPYTGHCYYCDGISCVPGCGGLDNSANCPDNYECNPASHECELKVCDDHPFCDGWDQICNANYDNCFFCGGDCGSNDGCCEGCHDSNLNCQYPTPICNGNSHICGCWNDNDCNVGDFCNTDTNACEAQCLEDTECIGFDEICNENYDNCFYCGVGDCNAQDGCCPGCHDSDLNCQYPTPICLGNHICGCESDPDCNVGDFCNSDTNSCEKIPDECKTDADCNVGLSGVCGFDEDGQTIDCKYCESNGLYNVCKPGCKYDSGSSEVPRCPVGLDECNVDTHNCQANSGSTLLTKIVFTSKGCNGCTQEGVNMTLVGDSVIDPQPRCKTVDLDHPNQVDFAAKSTFIADPSEQNLGWGNCWQGALEGRIEASTVSWTGEGTWMPESICYDWSKTTNKVFICTFPDGTSLTNGQSASGSCGVGASLECP